MPGASSLAELSAVLPGRGYLLAEPYLVEREKIREFAAAIGDDAPYYRNVLAARAAGYPDVLAPPTFPIVVTMRVTEQLLSDPDVGIDVRRLVHADQRFEFGRPVHAGDVLSCTLEVTQVRSIAGNALVSTQARVVCSEGSPVATAESTLLVRSEL